QSSKQQRNGDNRSSQNEDNADRIVRPDKQRQSQPGHSRRAHGMHSDDKIKPGENGRKTVDENSDYGRGDRGIRINTAQWRVEGPAGVQTAGCEGIQNKRSANQVNVPAQQIDLWKSQILRADHDGDQEI